MILLLASIVLAAVLLVVVIKRAAKLAERESEERAARKWGKEIAEPGSLEAFMKERPQWGGQPSGESKKE